MTKRKIKDLPTLSNADDLDLIPIVDIDEPILENQTKKITVANLLDGLGNTTPGSQGSTGPAGPQGPKGEPGDLSPLTTKGDLFTFDTDQNRLPAGPDGYILSSNSNTSTGLEWITATTGTGAGEPYVVIQSSGNLPTVGDDESISIGPAINSTEYGAVSIGSFIENQLDDSLVVGQGHNLRRNLQPTDEEDPGSYSGLVLGAYNNVDNARYPISIGHGIDVGSTSDIVDRPLGIGSGLVSGSFAIGLGTSLDSTSFASTAIGYRSESTAFASIAIGYDSTATDSNSLAIGHSSSSRAQNATSIGFFNSISSGGDNSIAIGSRIDFEGGESGSPADTTAIGDNITIGSGSRSAVVIGSSAGTTNVDTVAIGHNSSADSANSIAIGANAVADAGASIQLGQGSNTTNSTLQLFNSTIANAEGLYTSYTNPSNYTPSDNDNVTSHLQGIDTALGSLGGSGGSGGEPYVQVNSSKTFPQALGTDSLSIGPLNVADGNNNIAIGSEASALNGYSSFAIGYNTIVHDPDGEAGFGSFENLAIGSSNEIKAGYYAVSLGHSLENYYMNSSVNIGFGNNITGDVSNSYEASNTVAIGRSITLQSCQRAVAIGDNININDSFEVVAIGAGANANADKCIQLGDGTNSTSSTLQFRNNRLANSQGLYTSFTTPSNYSPTDNDNITSHLQGIDTALASAGGEQYFDSNGTVFTEPNASGNRAIAVGASAIASDTESFSVFGDASGEGSVSIGVNTSTTSIQSVALGTDAQATAVGAIQLGQGTNSSVNTLKFRNVQLADGDGLYTSFTTPSNYTPSDDDNVTSHLQGIDTALGGVSGGGETYVNINSTGTLPNVTGADAIAIGEASSSLDIHAISIGRGAYAGSSDGIAIGSSAISESIAGICIGVGSRSTGQNSVQIGLGTNSKPDTLQFLANTIATSNGVKIPYQTTGAAPTSTPVNGTLVLDSSGGTTTLWARSNGSWVSLITV